MAVAVMFLIVGTALKLEISRRRRVMKLSPARRNLPSTCTKFTVVSMSNSIVSIGRGASLNSSRCTATSRTGGSTTIPIMGTAAPTSTDNVRGIIVVSGLAGCSGLHGTVGSLNMAKVAIARIVNYNVRGNTNRGCHKTRLSTALLPGIGIRMVINGVPMRGIVRATGGALCAKRVKSNGVFICSITRIIGIHANRRKVRTLRSMRWYGLLSGPLDVCASAGAPRSVVLKNFTLSGWIMGHGNWQ